MKNILLLIFGSTLLTIATTSSKKVKAYMPPGTVKVENNLFVDKTEVCNMDWKEFLFWTERKYGLNSTEYLAILPDTTIWNQEKVTEIQKDYLRHPAFSRYPVVGITLKQAELYCSWRTARVNEVLWMKSENKTWEDVENLKVGSNNIPQLVDYRLPTKIEWEAIANNPNLKYSKRKMETWHYTYPTENKNNNRISGLNDNVSELTSEAHVAMGGNWKNGKTYDEVKYKEPSNIIGFRCICQFNKK